MSVCFKRGVRFLGIFAAVVSACASAGLGVTITWTGGAGTNAWGTAANWDLNREPGTPGNESDDVVIPNVGAAANVTFSANTRTIKTLTAQKPFVLSGGTLNITDTTNGSTAVNFTLSGGGTLSGAATLTVTGTLNWTGGTMRGNGTTVIAPGGGLSINTSSTTVALGDFGTGRTLENQSNSSSSVYTGTYAVEFWGGGTFHNAVGAQFKVDATSTLGGFSNRAGTNSFINDGTVVKTGSNTWTENVACTNNGVLDAQAGMILFNNTSTHSASSTLMGSGHVTFNPGTHSISGAVSVAALDISGGVVGFPVPVTASGTVNLSGSGTLGGAATLTITGTLNWTGGTMNGNGTTVIGPGGVLTINTSSGAVALGTSGGTGRTLENQSASTASVYTGTYAVEFWGGGTFHNAVGAQFKVDATSTLGGFSNRAGTNSFINDGTVVKTGSNTWTENVACTNNGVLDAQAGMILFNNTSTHSASSTLMGSSHVAFNQGTHSISGAVSVAALDLSGGVVNFPAPVTASGTVNLSGGGTLGGAATLTITGTLNWTGGTTMNGNGTTVIGPGGVLTINTSSGAVALGTNGGTGRTLENQSASTASVYTGTYAVEFWGGGTFHNAAGAQFKVDATSTLGGFSNRAGTNSFINDGTVVKTGSNTWTENVACTNNGVLDAQAGMILFNNTSTHSASSTLMGSGHVTFNPGTHSISGAVSVAALDISGGVVGFPVPVTASGTVNLSGSGTLGGAATLTITGTLNWTGGTMNGNGTTVIGPGGVLTINTSSGAVALGTSGGTGRTLENQSASTASVYTGTYAVEFWGGGTFHNAAGAQFKVDATSTLGGFSNRAGTNSFINDGTVVKTGSNTWTENVACTNNGVLDAQAGMILFNNTSTHSASSTLMGSSHVAFNQGTHSISGAVSVAALDLSGGVVNFPAPVTASGTVNLSYPGTLGGAGTLSITGGLNWTGGTMNGNGTTVIGPGGVLTINTSSGAVALGTNGGTGRTLENQSASTASVYTGTYAVEFWGGGTFHNAAGAQFKVDAASANRAFASQTGTNSFVNDGTVVKTGSNTWTENVPCINNGVLDIQAGTLDIVGTFANFAGTTLTGGTYKVAGTLKFANANIVTNAASIILDGTASAIINRNTGGNGIANLAGITAAGGLTLKNNKGLTTPGALANAGQTRMESGGTLIVNGAYNQLGGSLTLDSGALQATGGANITAGTAGGNGTITANTINAGSLRPGLSPGLLNVNGDYTQTTGGSMEIEIGGLPPGIGGYDRLAVTGTATLAGTLTVSLYGGFQPEVGDTFDIVTAGTVTGAFTTTNLPLNFGGDCDAGPYYSATAVTLVTYEQSMFTQQPQSQTVCAGDPVTFSVVAEGSLPISYHWRKNGEPIDGANASEYTIDPVSTEDGGDYDCVIGNYCGSTTSEIATLTVHTAPVISQSPDSAARCEGQSVTFSTTASGIPAPDYQWRKDGYEIDGANASDYTIAIVALEDAGTYDCVVTNECGQQTTTGAALDVFATGSGPTSGEDIQAFVTFLIDGGTPGAAYCAFDMNGDGLVDTSDVPPFVAALLGP